MAKWDAARWRAVSAEIDEILDLPREERQAALDALRARDAALAADVARLLAEQPAVEAGEFLEGDAASALPTFSSTSEDGGALPRLPVTLPAGATFGGYRIHRLLGRGGMGIVYEAEEIESGRRVALKILQGRFDDDRERERFQREGQLAASIDHEYCVFVFGAAEVDGTPSIAMELMQGTLADRIASQGPMPPAAAVDAALQLVAGLQAAQAAGILHRDVKPSNCFVDADGVVKIGDFGISQSTRPTQETTRATRGLVAATPAYAPPEQLRGAPLDTRSDIYSLGATIYELLTAERPFTGPDLMSLLMAVANDPPRPPHVVASAVPKGLSQVVLRCLAKRPEDRFQSYEALAAALQPYASWAPTPATLGRRLAAGVIDQLVIGLAAAPFALPMLLTFFAGHDRGVWLAYVAAVTALAFAYYALSESRWGATAGKAIMGLTVVDAHNRSPQGRVAVTRAVCYIAPSLAGGLFDTLVPGMADLLAPPSRFAVIYGAIETAAIMAITFSTARRHNGYAGLHDLASRTRVVSRAARAAAQSGRAKARATAPAVRGGERDADGDTRGGFVVVPGSIDGLPDWRPGYDPRLRRPVWIRDLPAGTPPIPSRRAALARPTRLRWLAGRRTEREAWDVYESVSGMPMPRALDAEADWPVARQWLSDLAHELAAQGPQDGPRLEVDRVWVLDSGRVKLLDDPTEDGARPEATGAASFLPDVMRRLRNRASGPWPLSAERLLCDLPSLPLVVIAARLESLKQMRPAMTPVRRLFTLAAVSAAALLMTAGMVATVAVLAHQWHRMTPDQRVTVSTIRALRADAMAIRRGTPADHRDRLSAQDRNALEIFLTGRHRASLGDAHLFARERFNGATDEDRAIVARALRRQPDATSVVDAAASNARVREIVRRTLDDAGPPPLLASFFLYGTLLVTAVCSLGLAAACRGVVLRVFGYELVTADGRPASRLRVTARAAVAWSPIFAAIVVARLARLWRIPVSVEAVLAISVLVLFAGVVYALMRPRRGIQDRLAGTWIVPR